MSRWFAGWPAAGPARTVTLSLVFALAAGAIRATAQEQEDNALGKEVYDRWCAGCHGVDGAGQGPGAEEMLPRPRDFTRAQYQIRTTASGELPTDDDIMHVIDVGMPGTAMPGWEDFLSREEREALVVYLKSFSRFFRPGEEPERLDFGRAPSVTDERLARGRELYVEIECAKCHGETGRGDGTSTPTLEDDLGFPIVAADLTENWNFNGGGTVEDIYGRLNTGLDGTPMPTFTDMVDAGIISDDDLWSLAHYVRSLSPEKRPEVREVITAERLVDGTLPSDPGDERWADADRFYVPLVGQIIVRPRWFNPRVDGIWVQALHDGSSLALRVTWSDPTESPADSVWAAFASRIEEVMEPEEDAGWAPGAPDRLVVQFPQTVPDGMERPFFLQGDGRRPAYLWTWESTGSGAREQVARGLGTAVDQDAASQSLETRAIHADGEWQMVVRRALATEDVDNDLQFETGRAVPIAFQAWDGDNAETGGRAAISTWYFISLGEPTPMTAYASPLVALVLSGLLGVFLVRQAQRKEREGSGGLGVTAGAAATSGD